MIASLSPDRTSPKLANIIITLISPTALLPVMSSGSILLSARSNSLSISVEKGFSPLDLSVRVHYAMWLLHKLS